MTRPAALSFGEVVIDSFPSETVVAGAPLHVAAHLGALGWNATLLTRVGDDDDGKRVLKLMNEWELDTSLVEIDRELPTGRVTIDMNKAGHTFHIHRPAAWDRIQGPEQLPRHDVFCFGSLIGRSARSLATLRRLLQQANSFRVMDANLRPPDVVENALQLGLEHAALLKLNGEEMVQNGGRARPLAHARGFLCARPPRLEWVCITRGEDGAELRRRSGDSWRVRSERVDVVDSVGAGDAFTAGLVDAIVRGRPGSEVLARALSVATKVLVHTGGLPRPPSLAEIPGVEER